MSDSSIIDLVEKLATNTDQYFKIASDIWHKLSEEEQSTLVFLATNRNTWDGVVTTDPVRLRLIEYKLITRAESGGEEGLVVLTMPGYAVFKSNRPKDPNITLPGETKL